MASIAELTSAPPKLDVSKMSKVQKLAALLIILGPESAAQILRTLESRELETVSAEMANLPVITQEVRSDILREMSEVALTAGTSLRGGVGFAQTALEKAVGSSKATAIMNRVSTTTGNGPAHRLADQEVRPVFNAIKEEHPQTIALVTSFFTPAKASELLGFLKPELRDQAVERLATLGATPLEVVEIVVESVMRKLQGRTGRALNQTGGVKSAADLLNAMNKTTSKSILSTLEERNAELGQAIRQKMLLFTDLAKMDAASLQKVMREVDMRDLALALKKADEIVKAALLTGISKRAAETVNEEIAFMGSVKLKEIDAAQMRIIEIVRRLEGEGEIDLESIHQPQAAAAA
ncbi:MAG TPA: flagellar motor switch protein FliG [Verrucomicrobiae bacterium]|jgi:flagellar motor switch protein FliG